MYLSDKIPFKLSLVNLFLSSLVPSFVRLLVHSFVRSLVRPFSHDQTYVRLIKFVVSFFTGSA